MEHSPRSIRLPLTATRRSQATYAKLLRRFDPRSRDPLSWAGSFLRPGAVIPETSLWPDASYCRHPLLLEFAGALKPAKGWNRHLSDETVVLWRYDSPSGKFLEVGRVCAPGAMWAPLIEPLVRTVMAEDVGLSPVPDLDLIRGRITRLLAAELDLLAYADRARVLTLVHDELGSRIAEWTELDPLPSLFSRGSVVGVSLASPV